MACHFSGILSLFLNGTSDELFQNRGVIVHLRLSSGRSFYRPPAKLRFNQTASAGG